MNPKTVVNLVPVVLEVGKEISQQAENYHRSCLEAELHKASNAEIRKVTRKEDGTLRSLLTPASSQRDRHLERTRTLPAAQVKARIAASGPSILDSFLTWLY